MAGGPYEDKYGNKYIIWDQKGIDGPVRESLKTKSATEGKRRKSTLESLYRSGKHKPDEQKWYYNDAIKSVVYTGHHDLEQPADTKSIPLQELKDRYISYKKTIRGKKGWGENVQKTVPYVLNKFVDMIGHNKPIDQIDEFDIQSFLYRPMVTSDHTRLSNLRDIKAMFNWGIEKGFTTNKITYQAETPQEEIPVFLTRKEIIDICGYHIQKNHQNIATGYTKRNNSSLWMVYAWMLMASTGLRPNELMSLKIEDVEKAIHVGRHRRTKTGKQRTINKYRWTSEIIETLTDRKVRESDRWMRKRDWLFGRHGDQAQRHLSDHFREARKALFPDKEISLYNLRHSFAVWFLTNETELSGNQDRRLYELMRILGHENLSTTQTYLKAIPLATQLE